MAPVFTFSVNRRYRGKGVLPVGSKKTVLGFLFSCWLMIFAAWWLAISGLPATIIFMSIRYNNSYDNTILRVVGVI